MLRVTQPTYTLLVTVKDRPMGGAWDPMSEITGCDEILRRAKKALAAEFAGAQGDKSVDVFFQKFEHQ